jgi:hypothetical protein
MNRGGEELLSSQTSGSVYSPGTAVKNMQQKAGVLMQTKLLPRLYRGIFRAFLVLITLLAAQILLVIVLIQRMRRDKRLRAKMFKPLNAVTLPLAGRRFSSIALLRHTGRRSGRTYVTLVRAYPFGDGFVLGLTWGPDVDWCRNVMATGKGTLRWHGQEYVLERPEIIPVAFALTAYPLPIRLAMRMGAAKQCVWLHRPSVVSAKEGSKKDSAGVSSFLLWQKE